MSEAVQSGGRGVQAGAQRFEHGGAQWDGQNCGPQSGRGEKTPERRHAVAQGINTQCRRVAH